MKIGTSILWLLLIWIISILAFSFFLTIYAANMGSGPSERDLALEGLFMWFICGIFVFGFTVIFSFPAFVWFAITGAIVLKSKMNIWLKKLLLLLSNYVGIGASSAVAILIFIGIAYNDGTSYIVKKIMTFYPTWSIVFVSTLCIALIPITPKTKPQ